MPQMTPAQARAADPVLTTHARGYRNAQLVADRLFPFADVAAYGGRVIEFGKDEFKLYGSKRAPGSNVKRVTIGYGSSPYSIVPSALNAVVPSELMRDAAAVPGINLATNAVNKALRSLLLEYESDAAAIATTAANYDSAHKVTLSGTDVWSDAASDPVGDVEAGKEAIRASIGIYPNTLLLSAKAASKLRAHQKIVDRTANTGIRRVTLDLLAQIFEVQNVVVAGSVVANDADVLADVWGTAAVLAYVSEGAAVNADITEPSYGYGYRIEGMPLVRAPYWDQDTLSWLYGVSNDCTPVLAGMAAGYLITGAGL